MDPISHGIIGLALSSFSGVPIAATSAVSIGSTLGAMSPDLDFVIRIFKDDVEYLEHHRGFSHSVPMLALFSVVITLGLSVAGFEDFHFLQTLIWTFIGALSHTLFDILNSYGARILQRKRKGNLLTLYDPFISMICLYFIFKAKNGIEDLFIATVLIAFYLAVRLDLRERAKEHLASYFGINDTVQSVYVMPALKHFYKWDFVLQGERFNIVGQYNPFAAEPIHVVKKLKIKESKYLEAVKHTNLGKKFSDFSPNLHVEVINKTDITTTVRVVDMRYFFRNTFLHQATVTFDNEMKPVESIFHPYKLSKAVYVA